jgi:hypothetical protein
MECAQQQEEGRQKVDICQYKVLRDDDNENTKTKCVKEMTREHHHHPSTTRNGGVGGGEAGKRICYVKPEMFCVCWGGGRSE